MNKYLIKTFLIILIFLNSACSYNPIFSQKNYNFEINEMLLSGDIDDNDTVLITAGSDGLIVGDRLGKSGMTPPEDVVVH